MTGHDRMEPLGDALRHELSAWRFDDRLQARVRAALAALAAPPHAGPARFARAGDSRASRKPATWWWTGGGLAVAAIALFWSVRTAGPELQARALSSAGQPPAGAGQAQSAEALKFAMPSRGDGDGGKAAGPEQGAAATAGAGTDGTSGARGPAAANAAIAASSRSPEETRDRERRAGPTPSELTQRAALVAQVRVRSVAGAEVQVVVEQAYKGAAEGAAVLLWPGPVEPPLAADARLFLFAEAVPDRPGTWRPVGGIQGVFRISLDGTQAATDDDPATPVPVESLVQSAR